MTRRLVLWSGLAGWTAESARIELGDDGVRATGTQLGADPLPYRLDYALDATGPGFVTRHLRLAVAGEGWRRTLDLMRGEDGAWRAEAQVEGEADLPAPGGALGELGSDAVDCDLAWSPLTNLMPIRRHRLDEQSGVVDFTMAWVSVPDLVVHVDAQRYEHLAPGAVRFSQPSGFEAELQLDGDGLVLRYPQIAERVEARRPPGGAAASGEPPAPRGGS